MTAESDNPAWIYDDLPAEVNTSLLTPRLGRACAELLAPEGLWRLRKVDRLVLGERTEGRRRLSVDLIAPSMDQLRYGEGAITQLLIPVTMLRKEPLRDFDFEIEGRAAPVLSRFDNASLATAAVMATFETAEGNLEGSSGLIKAVWALIVGRPEEARELLKGLRQSGEYDGDKVVDPSLISDQSLSLLDRLCENYLLVGVAPESIASRRILVKYSFHWDVQSDAGRPSLLTRIATAAGYRDGFLQIETSAPFEAASYHLEVKLPDDLQSSLLAVLLKVDEAVSSGPDEVVSDTQLTQVAHLEGRLDERHDGIARMAVRVPTPGLRTVAGLVCLFLFLFCLGDRLLPHGHPALVAAGGGGGALLLGVPAAVLAMQARPGESAMTNMFVQPLRWVILGAAACLFVCATTVVGDLHHPWVDVWWWTVLAASGAATIFLGLGSVVSGRVHDVGTRTDGGHNG